MARSGLQHESKVRQVQAPVTSHLSVGRSEPAIAHGATEVGKMATTVADGRASVGTGQGLQLELAQAQVLEPRPALVQVWRSRGAWMICTRRQGLGWQSRVATTPLPRSHQGRRRYPCSLLKHRARRHRCVRA